jgi:hypothetical protein
VNAFPEEPKDITEYQFVLIRVRSLPVSPWPLFPTWKANREAGAHSGALSIGGFGLGPWAVPVVENHKCLGLLEVSAHDPKMFIHGVQLHWVELDLHK